MVSNRNLLGPIAAFSILCSAALAAGGARVLDGRSYHLGTAGAPEWDYFDGKTPHGPRLDIHFSAQANEREAALFLYQDDVKLDWTVELNGKKIGNLFLMEAPLILALPIPPGSLRDGENTLAISPPKAIDDIVVGEVALETRPLKEAVDQAWLDIVVTEASRHDGLPCRITIVNQEGTLVPFSTNRPVEQAFKPAGSSDFPVARSNGRLESPPNPQPGKAALRYATSEHLLAVRPGVVYTPDGKARVGVRPGSYTIYATRGFEYGLARTNLSINLGETRRVELQLRREVPTPGLVSSDTHIHTFTHSRHGDATVEERVVTLAGEGIELPIATDHEHLADFSQPAQRMGVEKFFTPVIGCETTTAKGHFNSFPITAGSAVPDNKILDWPRMMPSIRSTPGVRVVVLNHPRNIHSNFQPFASTNFNAVTGENKRGFEFSFDAIEVANSSALQSDLMLNFRDWFALLNYGYRVTAVGSSDCHDVSRYIVGQGRSYVACDDRDPARIDVSAACECFLKGRVLVSLGLLTKITVDGKFTVGDLATGIGKQIRVDVAVLGPSWIEADRVELFANGVKIREQNVEASEKPTKRRNQNYDGIKAKISWIIPRPMHDVHLVAIASGPGVSAPYWATARPYQPSSRIWKSRVIGATNPIWVDADGDGKFSSARWYAQMLAQKHGTEPRSLLPALASCDEAIAAQAASLLNRAGVDLRDPEWARQLNAAADATRRGFDAYLKTLAEP